MVYLPTWKPWKINHSCRYVNIQFFHGMVCENNCKNIFDSCQLLCELSKKEHTAWVKKTVPVSLLLLPVDSAQKQIQQNYWEGNHHWTPTPRIRRFGNRIVVTCRKTIGKKKKNKPPVSTANLPVKNHPQAMTWLSTTINTTSSLGHSQKVTSKAISRNFENQDFFPREL